MRFIINQCYIQLYVQMYLNILYFTKFFLKTKKLNIYYHPKHMVPGHQNHRKQENLNL